MNTLSLIVKEFVGMFIDDGNLASFSLLLIGAVTLAVKFAGMSPLFGGIVLFIGCVAILTDSVRRAARRR